MKNFKKFSVCIVLTMVIFVESLTGESIFASEADISNGNDEISTVRELQDTLDEVTEDGKITKTERNDVINNTDDSVINEYMESVQDDIEKSISQGDGELVKSTYISATDTTIKQYEYEINDAVTVKSTIIDEPEDSGISLAKTTVDWGYARKDLGKRKTTAVYEENLLGWAYTKLHLTLGYTVKASKMTTRYASTSGSTSIGSLSTTTEITDKKASKVGTDMNCNGSYTINVLGWSTTIIDLSLRVKWVKNVDSDTKYIYYELTVI